MLRAVWAGLEALRALRVYQDPFSIKMVFRTSNRLGVTMRDLGDTTAYLRRGIREILCLALFVFTFLAVEYLFDVRVAEFVPSNEVVIYESIVIGASVIGFFVRPLLYYRRPQAIAATSDITGVLLVSALLLMIMAVQFQVVIAGGLVACWATADRPPMPTLRVVLRGPLAWRVPRRFPMLPAFWFRCSTIW